MQLLLQGNSSLGPNRKNDTSCGRKVEGDAGVECKRNGGSSGEVAVREDNVYWHLLGSEVAEVKTR